jgi:hypothetical protein
MRFWKLALLVAPLLAACTYGPEVDRSRFESAVLLPDQQTIALAYRIERHRHATGLAAFPDGGVPKYLEDRAVVASVPLEGGTPRILLRLPNEGVPGTAGVSLTAHDVDAGHVIVDAWEQTPGVLGRGRSVRLRSWRLAIPGGGLTPDPTPDFGSELKLRGRKASTRFGPFRMLDREGDYLLALQGGAADELWLRRANGEYRLIDGFKEFYGLRGDELYYWSVANEAVVRNWRTSETRVIARYDPVLRRTVRLIRDDPTVRAQESGELSPAVAVGISIGGEEVLVERRRGASGARGARPAPIDLQALRR